MTDACNGQLVLVARQPPRSLNQPYSLWTCQRLADYLAEQTGIRVSDETVRHYLNEMVILCSPSTRRQLPVAEVRMEARMAADVKRKALFFLFLALIMTLVIGVGLPRLKFQPGLPLPSLEHGQVVVPPTGDSQAVGVSASTLPLIVMLIVCLVYLVITAYRVRKGIAWKELRAGFFFFLRILLILFAACLLLLFLLRTSQGPELWEPLPVPKSVVTMPLGPAPALLIWLVGIALASAAIFVSVWMIRSRRPSAPELWAQQAEKARQALLAGGDLRNVILRCYQEMSQALQEERQIQRDASMTTGEFEHLLVAKGIPPDPVHQLTQLFEAVRYGQWQPDSGEEQRALHSLDAILESSHAAGQGN